MKTMRPLAVAITLFTVAARPAATQAPYRVSAWDAVSVLAAGGLSVIPQAAGLPRGAPPCAPCDPASLPGLDHAALRVSAGQHCPTDVVGGAAVGTGIGWLAARLHSTGS